MKTEDLRALQAPLKQRYRDDPATAIITLRADGRLGEQSITCKIETGKALVEAGLHPSGGGDGIAACSGDMLLEALVACAGVTLNAVATAIEFPLRGGTIHAEGDIDTRGTLGVDRDAPVGFKDIRLSFNLDTDAPQDRVDKLISLTERYCVIYQTLMSSPNIDVGCARN